MDRGMTHLPNDRGNIRPHPDFDLDPGFLTVNHGSYGATPHAVRLAQRAWQDRLERQPTRFFATELTEAIRNAAGTLAGFLDAGPDDLVFVDNATTGCNAVLRSLNLQPGDQVVTLSHVYNAVRNTVRHVVQTTGAQLVVAKIPFPDPTPSAVIAAVTASLTPSTKLLVLDHITSASALLMPAAEIVAACHAAGVKVLIDGAHAPGQIDLSLSAIGADWYVGNCHKWLCAPKGCAFLHAQDKDGLHPTVISHGYDQGFLKEFDWTGTTDVSRFLAVTDAIAHHQRMGGAALRRRNQALARQATVDLAGRLGTEPGATPPMQAAMGVVRLPVTDTTPENAQAIRQRLLQAGTDAPVHALDGALWLRLSAFAYNEAGDYDRLAGIVISVLD
jgi:isopenicillin-N epimerase